MEGQAELVGYIGSERELNLPESIDYLGKTIQSYAICENRNENFTSLIYDELAITSIFIPDAVTKIGGGAFVEMEDLQTVTLGKNVTELGVGAFGACSAIKNITCYAVAPPAAGEMAFYEIPTDILVYVPIQSIEAYQAAPEWSGFSNFIGIGPFNIVTTVNDEQMGNIMLIASHDPDENGRYFYGTTLTLEAQANEGYHFVRWNDNQTNPSRIISVLTDLTLQAIFEKDAEPEPIPPVYYTVSLPTVEGATTDPASGSYQVESWDNFRFYLTLDKEYDLSTPVVTTNRGETIQPRISDGAYIIRYVRQPIDIYINGIVKNPNPVDNKTIETPQSKVWTNEGNLHIETTVTGVISIYTFEGKLLIHRQALAGEELTIGIPSGAYIVLIGQERFKVRI
ncbi:leucine-rich repeat protein [Parabacteroides faecis]|uniref:leucine-rich repeat protein n=1 Tax=Parabacteroides faecis TaxID=1217282 RepID=UPI00216415C4|nr:leucine-rich repeat protein [Parabacteroides faecis]MCS2891970.1 leucine-rich repeat protein [Parabacteroides faecis]UVQ44429.1 leucine-rich repeat protein [Parabacteroides faecis]